MAKGKKMGEGGLPVWGEPPDVWGEDFPDSGPLQALLLELTVVPASGGPWGLTHRSPLRLVSWQLYLSQRRFHFLGQNPG